MNVTSKIITQTCETIIFSSKETYVSGIITGIMIIFILYIMFKVFTRERSDP